MNKVSKEILQYIVDNYGKKTKTEMSEELGVTPRAIQDWSSVLRRAGINLPKGLRGESEGLTKEFVRDYLEKHPERRIKEE